MVRAGGSPARREGRRFWGEIGALLERLVVFLRACKFTFGIRGFFYYEKTPLYNLDRSVEP